MILIIGICYACPAYAEHLYFAEWPSLLLFSWALTGRPLRLLVVWSCCSLFSARALLGMNMLTSMVSMRCLKFRPCIIGSKTCSSLQFPTHTILCQAAEPAVPDTRAIARQLSLQCPTPCSAIARQLNLQCSTPEPLPGNWACRARHQSHSQATRPAVSDTMLSPGNWALPQIRYSRRQFGRPCLPNFFLQIIIQSNMHLL